jgi:uncharacterized membrane protein YoaK (UPF0700 family)
MREVTLLLSAVAGGVDALAIALFAGLFVSYMTGNSIGTATSVALADFGNLLPRLLPIPMFALGVLLASSVIEIGVRRNSRALLSIVLGCEAALLVIAMLIGGRQVRTGSPAQDPLIYVIASLAAVAMGMQNTTVRDESGRSVYTTFMTGSLIFALEEIVAWCFWKLSPVRGRADSTLSPIGRWTPNSIRLKLYGGMYCTYLIGGVAAILIGQRLYYWALILPVAGLLIALSWNLWRPLYGDPSVGSASDEGLRV